MSELIDKLEKKAHEIRIDILNTIYHSGYGHIGGSFSCVEILTALFFEQMKYDPKNPSWPDRDRFILCKGHAAAALYVVLAHCNYINKSELKNMGKIGSCLQGHPDMLKTHGIEISTGSLGQGLSVACGIAYSGKKLVKHGFKVYALLGDGELNEGQVWEAALFASHHGLDNLIAIVDRNRLQYNGKTEEVLSLEPLSAKWVSFGWSTFEVNGHDLEQIISTLKKVVKPRNQPKVIIAHTVKGKGVSFMENLDEWHGQIPDLTQYKNALKELEGMRK